MKINELVGDFSIWTTNDEAALLRELKHPTKLSHLSNRDQYTATVMIRKNLLRKIGQHDPTVVANEKN